MSQEVCQKKDCHNSADWRIVDDDNIELYSCGQHLPELLHMNVSNTVDYIGPPLTEPEEGTATIEF